MKPKLKNSLKRVLNLLLYLSLCGLVGTGALLTWKLVPRSRGGGGLQVLGMDRHEWGDLHFWLGATMVVVTVAHLLLNWQWLKKIASSGKMWRLVMGLLVGLMIICGIYFLPLQEANDATHEPGWRHSETQKGLGSGAGRGREGRP